MHGWIIGVPFEGDQNIYQLKFSQKKKKGPVIKPKRWFKSFLKYNDNESFTYLEII